MTADNDNEGPSTGEGGPGKVKTDLDERTTADNDRQTMTNDDNKC
jgi:hypothetical protein